VAGRRSHAGSDICARLRSSEQAVLRGRPAWYGMAWRIAAGVLRGAAALPLLKLRARTTTAPLPPACPAPAMLACHRALWHAARIAAEQRA